MITSNQNKKTILELYEDLLVKAKQINWENPKLINSLNNKLKNIENKEVNIVIIGELKKEIYIYLKQITNEKLKNINKITSINQVEEYKEIIKKSDLIFLLESSLKIIPDNEFYRNFINKYKRSIFLIAKEDDNVISKLNYKKFINEKNIIFINYEVLVFISKIYNKSNEEIKELLIELLKEKKLKSFMKDYWIASEKDKKIYINLLEKIAGVKSVNYVIKNFHDNLWNEFLEEFIILYNQFEKYLKNNSKVYKLEYNKIFSYKKEIENILYKYTLSTGIIEKKVNELTKEITSNVINELKVFIKSATNKFCEFNIFVIKLKDFKEDGSEEQKILCEVNKFVKLKKKIEGDIIEDYKKFDIFKDIDNYLNNDFSIINNLLEDVRNILNSLRKEISKENGYLQLKNLIDKKEIELRLENMRSLFKKLVENEKEIELSNMKKKLDQIEKDLETRYSKLLYENICAFKKDFTENIIEFAYKPINEYQDILKKNEIFINNNEKFLNEVKNNFNIINSIKEEY